jgi:hypothetical protein
LPSCAKSSTMTCSTADDHLASGINAMYLKYRLGDIETHCRNHLHAWLL